MVSENPVTKTLADVAVQMAKNRDQFLQQAGDGKIGQVDTSYAGGGANPIVLASSPWGARLISQGQQVQVMSNTYTLRGTCYVNNVNNKLGLGAVHNRGRGARRARPPATSSWSQAWRRPRPVFLYGIPYFHNTATTGTYPRHQPDAELRGGERCGCGRRSLVSADVARGAEPCGTEPGHGRAEVAGVACASRRRSRRTRRWALPSRKS